MKVYCDSCVFYIPKKKHWSADGFSVFVADKCTNIVANGTRRVPGNYMRPAHSISTRRSPEEINKNNKCKSHHLGTHPSRLSPGPKKWWRFW